MRSGNTRSSCPGLKALQNRKWMLYKDGYRGMVHKFRASSIPSASTKAARDIEQAEVLLFFSYHPLFNPNTTMSDPKATDPKVPDPKAAALSTAVVIVAVPPSV